jgi:thioredoxin reductase (NADPH)
MDRNGMPYFNHTGGRNVTKIIFYSSSGCPYCATMKNDFKEWGYEYEEKNVTENPQYFEELHEQGIFSVPVVIIDDEPFIGYRPNKMKKKLGITEDQVPISTLSGKL